VKKAEIKVGEVYAISNRRDGRFYKSAKIVKFGDQSYNNKKVLVLFQRDKDYLSAEEKVLYEIGERFFVAKGEWVNYSSIRGEVAVWQKHLDDEREAEIKAFYARIEAQNAKIEARKVADAEREVLREKLKNSKLGQIVKSYQGFGGNWNLNDQQIGQILDLLEEVNA
jgi:flagellar motility protein MotE (MotC chaperone)